MKFDIIDHNVSTSTNIFMIIANIINLFYNIPQMYKTYKCKSTKDFSVTFIILRIVANIIWIDYAVEIDSMLMLLNNAVTVIATIFIGYYKALEVWNEYKNNREDSVVLVNTGNMV